MSDSASATGSSMLLPIEILLHTLSLIQPDEEISPKDCKAILIRLSSVCALFRAALIPRIFATAAFHLPRSTTSQTSNTSKGIFGDLDLEHMSSRQVVSCVKELTVDGFVLRQTREQLRELDKQPEFFRPLVNLRRLRLLYFPISFAVITAISSLGLEDLMLDCCVVATAAEPLLGEVMGKVQMLHMLNTTISTGGHLQRPLISSQLISLHLEQRSFDMMRLAQLSRLSKLSLPCIYDEELPALQALLAGDIGRTLEDLSLKVLQKPPFSAVITLRPAVPLPALKHFSGPRLIAPLFTSASAHLVSFHIRGDAHLFGTTFIGPALAHDLLTFPNLKFLSLASSVGFNYLMSSPHLESLHWTADCQDWPFSAMDPAVSHLKQLCEILTHGQITDLSLEFTNCVSEYKEVILLDLKWQQALLDLPEIRSAFPKLLRFSIMNSVGWRRAVVSDQWKAYMPHDVKESLLGFAVRARLDGSSMDAFLPDLVEL